MLSRIIEVKNLSQAWHRIGELFLEEEKSLRGAGDYFLYLYNVIIESRSSLAPVLKLEDMGYTSKKVTHLLKTYIDSEEVNNCLNNLKHISERWKLRKVFTDYPIYMKKSNLHLKGPCILGANYKDSWESSTLTIYSRSMEFPRKALADIFLVSSLALIIKEKLNLDRDINIIWYVGTIWIKARIGARFYKIFKLPVEIKYKDNNFQNHIDKGWNKFIVNQGEVSYRELKKVQELYLKKIQNNTVINPLNSKRFLGIFKNYLKDEL